MSSEGPSEDASFTGAGCLELVFVAAIIGASVMTGVLWFTEESQRR